MIKTGVVIGEAGLRIAWRGVPLRQEYGMLEPLPDVRGNQTRIGLDGDVQVLDCCRVQLSTSPSENGEEGTKPLATPGRRGTGPFDGWIVDTTSGFRIAWRGLPTPLLCVTSWPAVRFPNADGGYLVTFHHRGITATGSLTNGEVILDSLPPKSLERRLRRARRAGAQDCGRGLLRYLDPEGATWPPPTRNRNKRGHGQREQQY